jgi:hypothetical protein
MRIHFERTGGLAAPAMKRSCTIDTVALPEAEAKELAELVAAADFFKLAPPAPAPKGRDMFHYKLTVDHEGRQHTVEAAETSVPAALRPLINWLKSRAAPGA